MIELTVEDKGYRVQESIIDGEAESAKIVFREKATKVASILYELFKDSYDDEKEAKVAVWNVATRLVKSGYKIVKE